MGALFKITFLEMDIAFACDLHCPGCTHYSNYGLKGRVPFSEGAAWLKAWSSRLWPETFHVLGGEPTLNPELPDYLRLIRDIWPETERVLVSNGLGFHRQPGLFELLAETSTRLDVSRHTDKDPEYNARFAEGLAAVEEARARLGFSFTLRPNENTFYRTYQGEGPTMRPFADNDPEASWRICFNKTCWTIHEGHLWKCPPLAFLGKVADRLGLRDVPEWGPYLGYRPLPFTASDDEVLAFFRKGAEGYCAMCPKTHKFEENEVVTRAFR
jgi:hypothetical protein